MNRWTFRPSLKFRLSLGLILFACLLLSVSATYAQAYTRFGKNKIKYQDFDWSIYRSPHFDVYYYPEEEHLLEKVISYAESAYDNLSQEFDYKIQERTPLIFYETHAEFEQNNIILNFIPEGIGAFASSVRNRMVLPVDLPDHELMELILHELTHIFQYHVLYRGSLGKGLASSPPQWFTEGMASYMAKDESARDLMFLRDATVNDRIPAVTQANVSGFFAYRFGHAVFDFIEEKWGKDSFLDFVVEMRNTLGSRVGRAVERTFQMTPEDFDSEFRRWLRKRYLRELIETGEPGDFGRPFRVRQGVGGQEISPAASPSGDLVAAFATHEGDIDVVLFDARNRTLLKNLTKGWSNEFRYLVAQELSLGRKMGRDLAFSPDGDTIALFGRREAGRSLILIDVLKGKIRDVIDMDVHQQLSPAFSPDGSKIAFSGNKNGRFDIFVLDLDSGEIENLTNDDVYDGSPVYSPDGQSMVLTSVVGGFAKLFRIDLDNPTERIQLTGNGDTKSNDIDATFSPDGSRLYYTSDATGANNIFSLELETGVLRQHTDSVTGCFMPTVLASPDGKESLVYTAYWKGRFDLYRLDLDDPISDSQLISEASLGEMEGIRAEDLPRFQPSIEVTLDEANEDEYGGFKFFLEGISGGTIGISDDQTFIASIAVQFSDFLGDRRIIASFQSVSSFQNFSVLYLDLSHRTQWTFQLFDDEDFFITGIDPFSNRVTDRQSLQKTYGALAGIVYPLDTSHRVQVSAGYIFRELNLPTGRVITNPDTNIPELEFFNFKDDYPIVQSSFTADTATFAPWGAVSGRRWQLGSHWAADTDGGGTLTSGVSLDFRQYLALSRRSNFAFRVWAGANEGNSPNVLYIGGLDTLRGVRFRSLTGDRAFFSNVEFRFPLIDQFSTPVLSFQGIRGVVFFDVGGAWVADRDDFKFFVDGETQLQDAIASYGWGFTVQFFGLDLNWDFAKLWDLKNTLSDFETSFWIGRRF